MILFHVILCDRCQGFFQDLVKGSQNGYLGAKYYLTASKVYGKLGDLGIGSIPLCEAQSTCVAC